MLDPRDLKDEGTYRGGKGTTPVTHVLLAQKIAEGKNLLRVITILEPQSRFGGNPLEV